MQGQCPIEDGTAVGYLRSVPKRAILIVEQDEVAIAKARFAAGVVQKHQREQALRLGLVGHQLDQRASEADCLRRKVTAAAVALVEDQVDDRERRGEPVGEQMVGRDPERDPGGLDLALGSHQPLSHRRHGNQERAGNLLRRQTAKCAQSECDLGLGRERWMAAGEDQLQPLVGKRGLVHRVLSALG